MQTLVRVLLAFAAVAPLACAATTETQQPPQITCGAGQYVLGTSCAWNPVTIAIGPTFQTVTLMPINGGAPQVTPITGCYVYSPDPTSVHANQTVSWVNNTSVPLTIFQTSNGTPLTTVAPGQTSGAVYWSTPGVIAFQISSCTSSSATFGRIIITVN